MTFGLSYFLPPLPTIRKLVRKDAAGCNISLSSRETVLDESGAGKTQWCQEGMGKQRDEMEWFFICLLKSRLHFWRLLNLMGKGNASTGWRRLYGKGLCLMTLSPANKEDSLKYLKQYLTLFFSQHCKTEKLSHLHSPPLFNCALQNILLLPLHVTKSKEQCSIFFIIMYFYFFRRLQMNMEECLQKAILVRKGELF